MDVHGGDGRVAIFRKARAVKAGYGNIFGDAKTRGDQAFHDTNGGEIVDSHYRGRDRRHFRDGQASGQPTLEAQVAVHDRSRLESEGPHSPFVGFQSRDVGFELRPAGHEGDFAMALLMQMFDDQLDSGSIVDSQSADVTASRREIQESDGDFSVRQFVDQPRADLGGHDSDTADAVSHVAKHGFVTKLPGARQKTFDDLWEKRIFNIGDNDSQRARVARSESAGVNVGEITEALYGGENQALSFAADLAALVQNIGDGRGGYACSFCYISYR